MESCIKYASIEDVVSTFYIILDDVKKDAMLSEVFTITNALKIINFGCIKETDQVLVMTNYHEIMTWIISYIYVPNRIISITAQSSCYIDESKWDDFHHLLNGYQYTKPVFMHKDDRTANCLKQTFDVVIVGYLRQTNESERS